MHDPVVILPAVSRTLTCQLNLTDKNVTDLGLHKQDLSGYRVVDLSHNKFTHEALDYILPCCERIPGLEVLKLHKNLIGDLGAEQIADFCKRSTKLRELHLSHNRFTAHGAVTIVHAAERSRSLCRSPLWLRLERNAVEHPAEVADALQQTLSVCFRVDRTACNSLRCAKNSKVHLPYFFLQGMVADAGGGVAARCGPADSPRASSKRPLQDLMEDVMGIPGLVELPDAHSFSEDLLAALPADPKIATLAPAPMLKRRLSNRHVPGLTAPISGSNIPDWCRRAWDAGNPCKRSNTKTNEEQALTKSLPKLTFASGAGEPFNPPVSDIGTLPPFPPLPFIPQPQQMVEQDAPKPGRCLLKPRRDDQADKGAHGLQKNVVMAKVDELSAWHEELKAREKYLHLCEDTVRELLVSEVKSNTLDVDDEVYLDREKSAIRQLEAWANGHDVP